MSATENERGDLSVAVGEAGRILCRCEISFTGAYQSAVGPLTRNEVPPREIPARPNLDDAHNLSGALDLFWAVELGRVLFPALAATQTPESLAAMLAVTRVIGMKVPGEHSVFIQLDFTFGSDSDMEEPFTYRVTEYRRSTQRLGISVGGVVGHGVLRALVRPAPVMQANAGAIRDCVSTNRFAGRKVIVFGGSRGLGEIAAKILAAGGAQVALTYRLGKEDADRVAADINSAGGKAVAFHFDTNDSQLRASLPACCTGFDHACYFATPPIVEGDGYTLITLLFEKFCAVYCGGLVRVAQWLAQSTGGKFALFNASTIAVDSPPLRNLEYAAAKAASEACCKWLASANPGANIYTARFPRLNTDQTASYLSVGDHEGVKTLMRELSVWLPV